MAKLRRFLRLARTPTALRRWSRTLRRKPVARIGKYRASRIAASTSEFAQKIAGRYNSRLAPFSPASFVLLRSSQSVTLQNFYQHRHSHTQLAPRVTLSTAQWAGQPHSNRISYQKIVRLQPDLQVERQILRQQVLRKETATLKKTSTLLEQHAQYFFLRFQRQESMARISYAASGQNILRPFLNADVTPPANAKPVGTVVLHKATPVANPDAREHAATAATKSARKDAQNSRSQTSSSSIDVNRLTDEVIQAIDRRILVQRERMGRS